LTPLESSAGLTKKLVGARGFEPPTPTFRRASPRLHVPRGQAPYGGCCATCYPQDQGEFLPLTPLESSAGLTKKLVGARGFEPPTPWSRTMCATRLRYAPPGIFRHIPPSAVLSGRPTTHIELNHISTRLATPIMPVCRQAISPPSPYRDSLHDLMDSIAL
jgi:hypothetical protein